MTAVQNARDAALETLLQTSRGGWSDGSLKRTVQRAGLDSRDAALCAVWSTAWCRTAPCWTTISTTGVPSVPIT